MKVLQINSVCGIRSTGRICTDIAEVLQQQGHECKIAYGRETVPEKYQHLAVRIGSDLSVKLDGLKTRLLDNTGFNSYWATKRFLAWVKEYDPDIIHLHNLHGYYLHLPSLFAYLKKKKLPVVWTLHDCWAYTGHCAYYTTAVDAPPAGPVKRRRAETHTVGCERWTVGCGNCVLKHSYPESLIFDRSAANWQDKRRLFTSLDHMVLTTPSDWLQSEVKRSFLKDGTYPLSEE